MIDIRVPLGALLACLGLLLAGYGAASDPALYQRSLGININLIWGLTLLVCGAVLFWFGRRARPR
ncbi:MAG: hypothetical protein JO341_06365 [Gammaproteobacteria bacterium]|nr:hypothetical protein [Gammaproteobacteria bacterium]